MNLKTLPLGAIASDLTFRQTLTTCLNLLLDVNPKVAAAFSVRSIVVQAQSDDVLTPSQFASARRVVASLLRLLNSHVPAFTYLGYHASDHGTLGVWVDLEALHRAEEAGKISQVVGSDWRGIKAPFVLDMSGAGLTLYRRKGKVEIWKAA